MEELYAATKNDKVMDFVIDKQLPFHEELIDLIENGSTEDLQEAWEQLKTNSQMSNCLLKMTLTNLLKNWNTGVKT